MHKSKGFAALPVIIVAAVLVVGGLSWYGASRYYRGDKVGITVKDQNATSTEIVDLKANGSDGPVSVRKDERLTIFWSVPAGSSCELKGTGANGSIGRAGNYPSADGQMVLGPGTESILVPGENSMTITCSRNGREVGSDTVVFLVSDPGVSASTKTYERPTYSFRYPSNFTVELVAAPVPDDYVSVDKQGCLGPLELTGPMGDLEAIGSLTDKELMAFMAERNGIGYKFEEMAGNGRLRQIRFSNSRGSSATKTSAWIYDDNMVQATYVWSSSNYSNVTGQKIDPLQGPALANACEDAYEGIIRSFAVKGMVCGGGVSGGGSTCPSGYACKFPANHVPGDEDGACVKN